MADPTSRLIIAGGHVLKRDACRPGKIHKGVTIAVCVSFSVC